MASSSEKWSWQYQALLGSAFTRFTVRYTPETRVARLERYTWLQFKLPSKGEESTGVLG
uniref:Uncharacterized protein n=1 Tax=Arundo donax TaxID=35708 RepID=A0A0A9EQ10_ARUDO